MIPVVERRHVRRRPEYGRAAGALPPVSEPAPCAVCTNIDSSVGRDVFLEVDPGVAGDVDDALTATCGLPATAAARKTALLPHRKASPGSITCVPATRSSFTTSTDRCVRWQLAGRRSPTGRADGNLRRRRRPARAQRTLHLRKRPQVETLPRRGAQRLTPAPSARILVYHRGYRRSPGSSWEKSLAWRYQPFGPMTDPGRMTYGHNTITSEPNTDSTTESRTTVPLTSAESHVVSLHLTYRTLTATGTQLGNTTIRRGPSPRVQPAAGDTRVAACLALWGRPAWSAEPVGSRHAAWRRTVCNAVRHTQNPTQGSVQSSDERVVGA